MGKILLIEPDRIINQAICLFFFPHHEVRAEASLPGTDVKVLNEYDLLVVGGSALRSKQWTPELTLAIQHCETPTIWLEEDESPRPFKKEKLLVVKKPIEGQIFQSAVDDLLLPKTPQTARIGGSPGRGGARGQAPREGERRRQGRAQQGNLQFIDLVDIVDEQSPPKGRRKQGRKSK